MKTFLASLLALSGAAMAAQDPAPKNLTDLFCRYASATPGPCAKEHETILLRIHGGNRQYILPPSVDMVHRSPRQCYKTANTTSYKGLLEGELPVKGQDKWVQKIHLTSVHSVDEGAWDAHVKAPDAFVLVLEKKAEGGGYKAILKSVGFSVNAQGEVENGIPEEYELNCNVF